MNEYKGLYYNNNEKEQHYYEGGAHFKYEDLYVILEHIANYREKVQKNESKKNFLINIPKKLNAKKVN